MIEPMSETTNTTGAISLDAFRGQTVGVVVAEYENAQSLVFHVRRAVRTRRHRDELTALRDEQDKKLAAMGDELVAFSKKAEAADLSPQIDELQARLAMLPDDADAAPLQSELAALEAKHEKLAPARDKLLSRLKELAGKVDAVREAAHDNRARILEVYVSHSNIEADGAPVAMDAAFFRDEFSEDDLRSFLDLIHASLRVPLGLGRQRPPISTGD